ncbi:MAG: hypothetical protein H8E55_01035 [Pelagibacterales bacterium]|nr:hypothetical protein [Pelagibacterales bacterium]
MRKLFLLLIISQFAYSQEYKITKVNGWNVRLFNSKVMIKDDTISFTYRKRPPAHIKISNIEVENEKRYFYAEVEPPLEESYYVLYKDGKKTILENYMVVNGDNIEIKMQLSLID